MRPIVNRRLLILIPVLFLVVAGVASAEDINWISKDELKALLDDPDTTVIDVRRERDWEASDVKIEGAVREDPANVSEWAGNYPKDRRLVFY